VLFKPFLQVPGSAPILGRTRGGKERKLVYGQGGSTRTRLVDMTDRERQSLVLDDSEILQLGRRAAAIEQHYGCPMDMEWARTE
jgi:pyruvate, water dikinase